VKAKDEVKRTQVQGEVLALESMRLVPRVSGYVAKIYVAEGAVVAKRDLLVTLESPELERDRQVAVALVQKAEALAIVASSAVRAARQGRKVAEADRIAAGSAKVVAQSAVAVGRANYTRVKNLHGGRAATDEELEVAELDLTRSTAELESASSAEEAAGARVLQAEANIALREAEAASATASVAVAKAEADRAKVIAGFAALTNPYKTARITRQFVDAGTLAISHKTELLELMNTSKVRIRFAVPRSEANHVKPGSEARLIIPGSGRNDVLSKVTRVTAALMSSSRTMFAEVELDNADGAWIPGTIVKVDLLVENASGALLVPSRALVKDKSDTYLWIDDNGTARRHKVKTGINFGRGLIRVLTGIGDGARVLVSGFAGLRDGAAILGKEVKK